GFSTGVTVTMFDLTGKTLVDTEWVRLYDGAGQIAYTGDASASVFGFVPYEDGTDLKVIRTTNAPITSGFTGTPSGEGHSGELRIFYTKDADSTDVASVIVPQDSLIEPPTGGANDGDTLVWNGTSAEWERREPYYLETAAQDQTSSMNGNGGGSRIFNRSSNFSNTQSFNISYGEASSSDWESSFGNWTAPSAGLYKFTVQFGLDAGEDASVRARLYTDSGSGFSARGNSFHVRGSTGEQLYMTNFTIARSFETGDRARIYFEENGGSGASNVDIENAAVIIERIGY
ncbi:MAG: hypothetical protein GY871_19780, partial [Actinomycetales bacterium]|nr:hypothetical protein [Actinomycetales bacterium]